MVAKTIYVRVCSVLEKRICVRQCDLGWVKIILHGQALKRDRESKLVGVRNWADVQ